MNQPSKRTNHKTKEQCAEDRDKREAAFPFKVGDELAFQKLHSTGWNVFKISHITPTGRMNCGPYVVNPDLTIRERSNSFRCGRQAYRITDEIRQSVKRSKNIEYLELRNWEQYPDETLQTICDLLRKQPKDEQS
jgi:hypothetical protein